MNAFKKSDLRFDDYSWTVIYDDDPRVTGKPDSTMFSRHEGYEVLSFINRFMEKYNLNNIAYGVKIEKMIHDNLPSNVRSQAHVADWLYDNWQKY